MNVPHLALTTAALMQHVATQMGHTPVLATKDFLEMGSIVQVTANPVYMAKTRLPKLPVWNMWPMMWEWPHSPLW